MNAYTFINFDPHLQYEDRHIAKLGKKYKIDQNIIPFSGKKIGNKYYQNVLKMVFAKLKDNPVDYAITCDSDRISLLAVSLLGIKGAHFFRSLANINAYVNDLEYIKLLKKRDVFTACRFLQERAKELLDIDSEVWQMMPSSVKCNDLKNRAKINAVGYYSSGRHKGDDIVNALIERTPHIRFIVIGGKYTHTFNRIPNNVEYLGEITDVKEFYKRIKILLVPSLHYDSFPRVILEAAVNGIPAIANKAGGIPEALGDSGILVNIDLDNFDVNRITEKYVSFINMLLNNEDMYINFSNKSLQRAKEYKEQQNEKCLYNYMTYIL